MNSPKTWFRFPALTVCFLLYVHGFCAAADPVIDSANKAAGEYRRKIKALVEWCEVKDIHDEARLARESLIPSYPDRIAVPQIPLRAGFLLFGRDEIIFPPLPQMLPKAYLAYVTDLSATRPEEKVPESKRLTDKEIARVYLVMLRQEYAKDLFVLAKRAARQQRGTLAVQIAMAALHADPDHVLLRSAFGFIKYKSEWRTPWEIAKLEDDFVDHPIFGWIAKKAVPRYEAGERFHEERWMSRAEEARLRLSIEKAWIIESERFLIATNHSLEEGVRLRRRLEDLYRAWKMLFFRFNTEDAVLSAMFSGNRKPTLGSAPRSRIVVYRDKADFQREQEQELGRFALESIAGFYSAKRRTCYFYSVDPRTSSPGQLESIVRTMYHEATHQLFAESPGSILHYGSKGNYWIVEGAAVYMESLRRDGSVYTLGGWDDWRLRSARSAFEKGFYLSPRELTAITHRMWNTYPGGSELYSQSAGVFHYLLHSEEGTFRDPVLNYLRLVYRGKDTSETFPQVLPVSTVDFKRKYEAFLMAERPER